eukprot:gb/GECG01015904.1/.p1 GENE.gb/GECG01015904.1/~~gb/GECG01015904.1/.p1  ORF type:complete len:146 (+),score=21.15 gb/GECG01015904.1/:1-438(+)
MKSLTCRAFHHCFQARRTPSTTCIDVLRLQFLPNTMPPQRKRRATSQPKNYDERDEEEAASSPKQQKTEEDTKPVGHSKKKKSNPGPRLPEGVVSGYHEAHDVPEAQAKGLFHEKKRKFQSSIMERKWYQSTLKKGRSFERICGE